MTQLEQFGLYSIAIFAGLMVVLFLALIIRYFKQNNR